MTPKTSGSRGTIQIWDQTTIQGSMNLQSFQTSQLKFVDVEAIFSNSWSSKKMSMCENRRSKRKDNLDTPLTNSIKQILVKTTFLQIKKTGRNQFHDCTVELLCCVFWPANGCFASPLLIESIFFGIFSSASVTKRKKVDKAQKRMEKIFAQKGV